MEEKIEAKKVQNCVDYDLILWRENQRKKSETNYVERSYVLNSLLEKI
jgi:hypothetical protein